MNVGEVSKITWTRSTYNHWWVCTEYGPGCDNCYAREFAHRLGWEWGKGAPRRFFGEKHHREPYKWNDAAKRSGQEWRVFAQSMSDWADAEVEQRHRDELFKIIRETSALTWLLLTKRVGTVYDLLPADWGDGYPNVRFGITVVNQKEADRDIPKMFEIPARSYWISAEPQLGPIYYMPWWLGRTAIDQIVTGGESGSGARPYDIKWARSTIKQCRDSGIAAFVKQLGSKPVAPDGGQIQAIKEYKGGNLQEWPEDLRVQEFPETTGT